MTVQDLAKLLAVHMGQGRAHYEITVFQWEHQAQPVTELLVREGTDTLEFYSGTDTECTLSTKWQETLNYGSAPADEADDYEDLI